MKTTNKTTIGEIAADDFRTAAIFSKYSIDFCYKGHRTLKEACKKRGIEELPSGHISKEYPTLHY